MTRRRPNQAPELLRRKATSAEFEAATWVLRLLGTKILAPEFARALRYLKL